MTSATFLLSASRQLPSIILLAVAQDANANANSPIKKQTEQIKICMYKTSAEEITLDSAGPRNMKMHFLTADSTMASFWSWSKLKPLWYIALQFI